MTRIRAALLGLVPFAALALAGTATARNYTFTKIADSSGDFSAVNRFAAINDAGEVAFDATLAVGGDGVFRGNETSVTSIAQTGSGFDSFGSAPSINDSGTVAFLAAQLGGPGIFTGDGGAPTPVWSAADHAPFPKGNPAIDASGEVAFRANLAAYPEEGLFRREPGLLTPIADSTGSVATLGNPDINSAGTVAFQAVYDSPVPGGRGIFTGTGAGIPTTVADASGPFSAFGGEPAINDAGLVAFIAFRDVGGSGIYTSANLVAPLASTGASFESFSDIALNDAGLVAFRAQRSTAAGGGEGIFTGADAVHDKVIAAGDALFGSTVSALGLYRDGLNDDGTVAFYYSLASGVEGVAIAVPEPALFASWSVACGALVALHRGSRRACR